MSTIVQKCALVSVVPAVPAVSASIGKTVRGNAATQ